MIILNNGYYCARANQVKDIQFSLQGCPFSANLIVFIQVQVWPRNIFSNRTRQKVIKDFGRICIVNLGEIWNLY